VALLTTPGRDGHAHVAVFDKWGNGDTSLAADHNHVVSGCDVLPGPDGHTHGLTTIRAELGKAVA
jgi:hypothetical protein